MDNQTIFYILGIGLTALALLVSLLGIRSERFPPSTAVLSGIVAVFLGLIGATAAFAIASAKDEQEHRQNEHAAELEAEQAAAAETPAAPGEGNAAQQAEQQIESPAPDKIAGGGQGKPAGGEAKSGAGGKKAGVQAPSGKGGTLELAADPTQLLFDETSLSSAAGEVTINLDNPAAVPHNVAIASNGDVIAESETVSQSTTSVSAQLDPGSYEFLCTIPGHAEAGMQGTLTVK